MFNFIPYIIIAKKIFASLRNRMKPCSTLFFLQITFFIIKCRMWALLFYCVPKLPFIPCIFCIIIG